MATNNYWGHPTHIEVAQITKQSVSSYSAAQTFVITLTDDKGRTEVVTYTATGSEADTSEVATAIAAAWNASSFPDVSRITASTSSAIVILTADTAGVGFSVAFGGTGTWADPADDTVNLGNNHGDVDANWSQGSVPAGTNADDIIIGAGTVGLTRGLNFSSVTVTDIVVEPGFSGDVGRFEDGIGHYLRVAASGVVEYLGAGQLFMLDLGASNVNVLINQSGSPAIEGRHAAYLVGSNLATVEVVRGNVGIAGLDDDTAVVDTILCGYVDNQRSDVRLTIGPGTTISTELNQTGGECVLQAASPLVSVSEGSVLTSEGSGAITLANVKGVMYPKSSGAIAEMHLWGEADFTKDSSSRSLTAVTLYAGSVLTYYDNMSIGTITIAEGPVTINKIKKA